MIDTHHAFVVRKCDRCGGEGIIIDKNIGVQYCPECQGTVLIGSFEEVPHTDVNKINSIPYIAKLLRHTRESRKISMSDLAKEFGWNLIHLNNIERGRENVTNSEYFQIMRWIEKE